MVLAVLSCEELKLGLPLKPYTITIVYLYNCRFLNFLADLLALWVSCSFGHNFDHVTGLWTKKMKSRVIDQPAEGVLLYESRPTPYSLSQVHVNDLDFRGPLQKACFKSENVIACLL